MTSPENTFDIYQLTGAQDHEILMHREVHFGGEFPHHAKLLQARKKGDAP